MVEQFFSVGYTGRSDLFEGLSIWQEEKYRQLQGTYPVIALSFANIKGVSYQNVRKVNVAWFNLSAINDRYWIGGRFQWEHI